MLVYSFPSKLVGLLCYLASESGVSVDLGNFLFFAYRHPHQPTLTSHNDATDVHVPCVVGHPPPYQVLEMRGDSFQHFGNAAIVQSIVDKLPEIAGEIAAPLAKTEKVYTTPTVVVAVGGVPRDCSLAWTPSKGPKSATNRSIHQHSPTVVTGRT